MFHGRSAQARQEDNHQEHIVDVVEAGAVLGRSIIVVLQGEEPGGVRLGPGEEVVGAEQEGQKVEGETWIQLTLAGVLAGGAPIKWRVVSRSG